MRTFSAADSQFFGGGMQNAYSYDHTGKLILIQEPGDYDGCWTIRKQEMTLFFLLQEDPFVDVWKQFGMFGNISWPYFFYFKFKWWFRQGILRSSSTAEMILSHTVEELSFCPEITTYFTVTMNNCDVAIILQSANHVYNPKSNPALTIDPKHCCDSVVFFAWNPTRAFPELSGWDAGSRSNPVPFFMSSKGYGSFRNTFKPGVYKFSQPVPWFFVDEFWIILTSMYRAWFSWTCRSILRKHRDSKNRCFGGAYRVAN